MASNTAIPTHEYILDATPSAAHARSAPGRPALWRRVLDRLLEARRRQAEAEVARYIAMNGGTLSDDLEREISRRFGGMAGR